MDLSHCGDRIVLAGGSESLVGASDSLIYDLVRVDFFCVSSLSVY